MELNRYQHSLYEYSTSYVFTKYIEKPTYSQDQRVYYDLILLPARQKAFLSLGRHTPQTLYRDFIVDSALTL